jgi:hypothetical protein
MKQIIIPCYSETKNQWNTLMQRMGKRGERTLLRLMDNYQQQEAAINRYRKINNYRP